MILNRDMREWLKVDNSVHYTHVLYTPYTTNTHAMLLKTSHAANGQVCVSFCKSAYVSTYMYAHG